MARIRSVHPGLTTDEAFMSMSMAAKAAWPLLWTECDDNGVFEWKPVVLKARILPADAVDFPAVMAEWAALGVAIQYDVGGKLFGAVKNFCKWQRPKKPNVKHPLPDQYRKFVGLKAESTEPVPNQFPTAPVIPPQREEEGGRREEVGKEESKKVVASPSAPPSARATRFDLKTLPDEWHSFCREQRPDLSPSDVFEQFRDFWVAKSGKDGRKLDWFATWRNWCRNQRKPNGFPDVRHKPSDFENRRGLAAAFLDE